MGSSHPSLEITRTVAPVRQQVLENLRRAIVEGRFRPADRLVERELCALTGASRSSVREALRQLEAEGLILTLPDRGPIVRSVSKTEAADLYQVRALLEGMAGKLFAERASDEEIAALRKTVDDLEIAFESGDGWQALRTKDRFYEILLAGGGSEVAQSLLQSLHNRISLVRATTLAQHGRSEKTMREMRTILEAIERRDPEAARLACVDHVEQAATIALRVLASAQADPLPTPVAAAS
jgi:GntR family transcriptional regulator, trigonelline degradation regulator